MKEIKGKYTSARIYSNTIDEGVIEQTTNICNHPIFEDCKIRIMPDCHKGKGSTIGFTSTMPLGGEIIPNIIGVDQSCGMLAIKLKECESLSNYEKLDKIIREKIPGGTGGIRESVHYLAENNEIKEKVEKACKDYLEEEAEYELKKIGTLGSGNHFIALERGKKWFIFNNS